MNSKTIIEVTQDNVLIQKEMIDKCVEDIVKLYDITNLKDEELVCLLNNINAIASNHLNQAFISQLRKNNKFDGTFIKISKLELPSHANTSEIQEALSRLPRPNLQNSNNI